MIMSSYGTNDNYLIHANPIMSVDVQIIRTIQPGWLT